MASSSVISFDGWWHEPSRTNWVQQWSEASGTISVRTLDESRLRVCGPYRPRIKTDLDADTTLLSVEGIGAFDLVSRAAMMRGLL